jgi:hypothetical protein
MTASEEQFARVERALEGVRSNRNRRLVEYEDNVWNFFQNAWHLKDWVRNDSAIDQRYRDVVEDDVSTIEALQICADLANRSKHLQLTRKRLDADVSKRNTHIYAGTALLSWDGKQTNIPGYGELIFIISAEDGREFDLIHIAEQVVNEWRRLLAKYGVCIKPA